MLSYSFSDNCINLLPLSGLHKLAIFSGAPLQYTSICGSPKVRVITLILYLLPVSGLHKLAIFSGAPLQYTSIYGPPRVSVIILILWQLYKFITCIRITQTGNLLRCPFTIYFHMWVTKGARNNTHSLFITCIRITQTGNLLRCPFTIYFHIWAAKGKCYHTHSLTTV